MVEWLLEGVKPSCWQVSLPTDALLHPVAQQLLKHTPAATASNWDEAVQLDLYTDGSFSDSVRAGWSVAAFLHTDRGLLWAGFLADRIWTGQDDRSIGITPECAHPTELVALLHALAMRASAPVAKARVFCDATSAILSCSSPSEHPHYNSLTRAIVAMRLLGEAMQRHTHTHIGHIPSHEGHPGNELADSLAKWAANSTEPGTGPADSAVVHSAGAQELQWLWITVMPNSCSFPQLQADGTFLQYACLMPMLGLLRSGGPSRSQKGCRASCYYASYSITA